MRIKQKDDAESKKVVRKASRLADPLSLVSPADKAPFQRVNGEEMYLQSDYGTRLSDDTFDWAFSLFGTNMRLMYSQSEWGWTPESKRAELQAATSRYLLVRRRSSSQPLAFVHYRFVVDSQRPVLYCYELQVEPAYQRQGVGTLLLDLLAKIASKTEMQGVMATVFAFNGSSLDFFRKAAFVSDATTPPPDDHKDYVILFKAA